jgi:predicted nucleic acid-binding protein
LGRTVSDYLSYRINALENARAGITKKYCLSKIFDLRLAAVALSAKVDSFVTYNVKDFQDIENLTVATPQQILVS